MNGQEDGEWLTYIEAGKRLGVTPDTLRHRVRRGAMTGARGNDGKPRVWVSVQTVQDVRLNGSEIPFARSVQTEGVSVHSVQTDRRTDAQERRTDPAGMVSLEDVRSMLGEQSDRLERQHNRSMVALQEAHRATVEMLVERMDAAECRVESLLEHVTKPWWKRWFG